MADNEDEKPTEQFVLENTEPSPEKETNDGNCPSPSIYISDFCDFIQKPQILRAIDECGFEFPFKVQYKCMPQAVLGMDILCQAKSGMGKTSAFVLATLQQIDPTEDHVYALVICNTRVRAFHISKEFVRFAEYMPALKVGVFFGGLPIQKDTEVLQTLKPHIVVGTPGRILAHVRSKLLNLKQLKHFILDDCGTSLEQLDMRRNIQEIFRGSPYRKQVMMFSDASLSDQTRAICKKFMQNDAIEIL